MRGLFAVAPRGFPRPGGLDFLTDPLWLRFSGAIRGSDEHFLRSESSQGTWQVGQFDEDESEDSMQFLWKIWEQIISL